MRGYDGFSTGFGLMEQIFPFLFIGVFVLVACVFISAMARGVGRFHRNNASPVLTVRAKVIGKRTDITHHMRNTDTNDVYSGNTWYYVAFEVESGDRMEFEMPGGEYGLLAEGDTGELTFQGTRYKGFTRK